MDDTICAVSTALGVGAISIIRLSGEDSIDIVNKIFEGKNLNKVNSHTVNYGKIKYQDEIIDEVLVTVMKEPKTFTRENVVEINCHGGVATTNKILEILLLEGCRLAEPGEFTKRAFLNGRIDLIEAESVMNLINAKTEQARTIALNGLNGEVSKKINELKKRELEILSNIEVNIDYPEYNDIEVLTNQKILPKLKQIKDDITEIIKQSYNGKLIKEGINVSIVGKPNVGKSSLLNLLLEEEKAIVTDIEGTTRDVVEGQIVLDGIVLNLLDTAGIRKTDNTVEKIGVEKSLNLIEKSDLIIFVLDNSRTLTPEENELLNNVKNKNYITVINKCDLDTKLNIDDLNLKNIIKTSAKEEEGLELLKQKIREIYSLDKINVKDLTYVSNSKNISLLKESLKYIDSSIKGINDNIPIDMVEIDIKESCEKLSEILGENYNENLINELFSNFCLGK